MHISDEKNERDYHILNSQLWKQKQIVIVVGMYQEQRPCQGQQEKFLQLLAAVL